MLHKKKRKKRIATLGHYLTLKVATAKFRMYEIRSTLKFHQIQSCAEVLVFSPLQDIRRASLL